MTILTENILLATEGSKIDYASIDNNTYILFTHILPENLELSLSFSLAVPIY